MMKKAFTLSEVLITLSIIGVVAALTIPTFVKIYRYKMYASQLQKTYSQLQTATKSVMEDEMTNNFYQTTAGVKNAPGDCSKGPCYFAKKYLKTAMEDCGYTSSKKCVADNYVTLNGTRAGRLIPNVNTTYCIQTINGATVCFMNNEWTNSRTRITIDVNGPEPPNTVGLDAFIMNINTDGTFYDWGEPEDCGNGTSTIEDICSHAPGCLNKVIKNNWVIKD